MEYLGVGGPLVNATLPIDINRDCYSVYVYRKTLKIEQHKHYKHFTPFEENITNIRNRKKNY